MANPEHLAKLKEGVEAWKKLLCARINELENPGINEFKFHNTFFL